MDELVCPVSGCSFEGTLSSVIHHITTQEDDVHTWEELGYQHSGQFRREQTPRSEEDCSTSSSNPSRAGTGNPLDAVPGVGKKRATALRKAGYRRGEDIAGASVSELSDVSLLSDSLARCIRVTAQEECGYSETFISRLADSLDAERTAVADAYADLAGVSVPPTEARGTLEALFNPSTDCSVMELSGYSVRFRHFLLQEGFDHLSDVAEASIAELSDVPYFDDTLAENIREEARELQTQELGASSREVNSGLTTQSASNRDEGLIAHEGGERADISQSTESLVARTFPEAMKQKNKWLLWKATDDGRKVPRAPWETGDPLQYVSALDPVNWVSFSEALQWQAKLPQDFNLAYALTRDDEIAFLDLDGVVTDGSETSEARALVERAASYTAVSTSGTGLHIFVRGSLSEGIKSLTGPIDKDTNQSLEVYDRNRFIAVTGDHLDGTPTVITSGDALLDELENEFASINSKAPDRADAGPERTREELREIETTHNIQDVFDAISQTRPSDIRMRSTKTREHGDGTYSYDPSWVHSESGTRLGVLDDVWIYRKGMIALDALQLVALEEGIITDEREYPEEEDFWDAVEVLRSRGAHIPRFEPASEQITVPVDEGPDAETDKWEVARRINYGTRVRGYLHPYDRNYMEDLALDLTPTLIEAAGSLHLPPTVTYRAAELYAKGHAAGIVPGAAHESSLGAALRIASIEADMPRPLADIAAAVEEESASIRKKFHRLMKETDLSETHEISDFIVEPADYVPYMSDQLGIDDAGLCESVHKLLMQVDHDGSSNPMSEVAAAFYVAMKNSDSYSVTQEDIANAAGLSTVTIRNNYRKYTE